MVLALIKLPRSVVVCLLCQNDFCTPHDVTFVVVEASNNDPRPEDGASSGYKETLVYFEMGSRVWKVNRSLKLNGERRSHRGLVLGYPLPSCGAVSANETDRASGCDDQLSGDSVVRGRWNVWERGKRAAMALQLPG